MQACKSLWHARHYNLTVSHAHPAAPQRGLESLHHTVAALVEESVLRKGEVPWIPVFLALHRFGDMQIHDKFSSNLSHSLLPYRLCKDVQVRNHQLWVEPCTERHVAIKRSLISYCAPHKNTGPVVIVRTQQFQSCHSRQQFHARS